MAITKLDDIVFGPAWIRGVSEKMNTYPSIMNSGAVVRNAGLDAVASGRGETVNVTGWKDNTDTDDDIQEEDDAIGSNKVENLKEIAAIHNRELPFNFSAFSSGLSGEDPVGYGSGIIAVTRLKNRMKTLLSSLEGYFGSALSANTVDKFVEAQGSQTPDHMIDADKFADAVAKLGENGDDLLANGVIIIHPTALAGLRKQDEKAFDRTSQHGFIVNTYKGIPYYTSGLLSRDGNSSGKVFTTYLLGAGSVGWGEKPQVVDQIDVASLQIDLDKSKNNIGIYDRTRFVLHMAGSQYKPDKGSAVVGHSPTNAELKPDSRWGLAFQSADRVPMAAIRTNG